MSAQPVRSSSAIKGWKVAAVALAFIVVVFLVPLVPMGEISPCCYFHQYPEICLCPAGLATAHLFGSPFYALTRFGIVMYTVSNGLFLAFSVSRYDVFPFL
jgi:hypothetical protein